MSNNQGRGSSKGPLSGAVTSSMASRRGFLRGAVLAGGGLAAGGTLLSACGSGSGGGDSKSVYVADYGGTIQDATKKYIYDPFTKETGIEVVIVADPSVAKIQAMVDSGNVEWDLVSGSLEYVLALGTKYFEELPASVQSVKGLNPSFMHPYAAGYYVFSTVNAWNTDLMGSKRLESWADFWNTDDFEGKRSLFGGDPPLEMALLADGVAISDLYPLDVERGFAKLEELSKSVPQYWDSGAQAGQLLVSKQVAASSLYSGTTLTMQQDKAPIDFTWQGGMFDPVQWVVPKGAANKKAAFQLIEYSIQPEVQARFVAGYPTGTTNTLAFDSLTDDQAKLLPTYPEHAELQFTRNIEWWAKNRASVAERWTKFKVS